MGLIMNKLERIIEISVPFMSGVFTFLVCNAIFKMPLGMVIVISISVIFGTTLGKIVSILLEKE